MLENKFQSELITEIEGLFPGCVVLKNDASYIQGFPDLTILYLDKWAVLESKKGAHEKKQPNQDYYVNGLNKMSFGSFIYPENKKEVLDELQQAFGVRRPTRISKSK